VALRGREEAAHDQVSALGNAFHESPTRNAFSSFAAQMHGMNHFMESTAEKLSVLERRTEPFSPSKHSAVQPNLTDHHPSLSNPISPRRLFPPSSTSTLSLLPSTYGPSNSSQSVSSNSPSPTSEPLSPNIQPSIHSAQIVASSSSRHPVAPASEFLLPRSNILSPATISASNHHTYFILPLSPVATFDQPLVHTPHDLVLPPASAFPSLTYPIFTTVDCTWQYLLDQVINPSPLWSSYAPGSLGDYADIKSIWQAWDDGTYIKNVGHKPALRLIDARWGNLESHETHKRKFPSWRPRNDNKVCGYSFFIFMEVKSYSFIIGPQDMVQFLFLYSPHRRKNQVRT
jgi:hypothetical protein